MPVPAPAHAAPLSAFSRPALFHWPHRTETHPLTPTAAPRLHPTGLLLALLALVALLPAPCRADDDDEASDEEELQPWDSAARQDRLEHARAQLKLRARGYGELGFMFHDYGPDQTAEGGAAPDARLVFDQTRFVLGLEGSVPGGLEFEAEVEFEHGGTGAALELEYEEYGEYEQEVEKGGEVVLEELYLKKRIGDHLWVKLGRFYVAVGQLYAAHRPTDYLGLLRPEGETSVIPGVWDEMGVELGAKLHPLTLTFQVVNGLDSTGFSSQFWIASGQQGRFEQLRASSLAAVARVDATPLKGLLVGASAYFGDTVGNRPKADMAGIFAPLLLLDGHFSLDAERVRTRGSLVWGQLAEAETISSYNRRLSNALNVPRTAVADQGLAAWLDLGVNLLPSALAGQRLEAFTRLEHYDTLFKVGPNTYDNPRFARTLLEAGLGYTHRKAMVGRLAWSRRSFASPDLRPETTVGLTAGFVY